MDMPTILIGFAVILISSIRFFSMVFLRKNKNETRLPPGPSPLPIIGNMHQLGKLPHRALHKLANKYGPIMLMRLGSVPVVVVSSSEEAKQFLKTHDLIFANRPASAAGKYLAYNHKAISLAYYGPYWRNMRKVCVLELLTVKRIESFTSVRKEEVMNMISCIWNMSQQGRVTVDVSKSMSSFTSDTTWRILAGKKLTDADLNGTGSSMTFKGLIDEFMALEGIFHVGDFIPYVDWLDLQGVKRRMRKAHKFFDGVAEKIIEEHIELKRRRRCGDADKEEEGSQDSVDVLLDMNMNDTIHTTDANITREDVKAIIFDMYVAGMETTATTLEWAMSEILINPSILKKLQQEIDSVVGKDVTIVAESDIAIMDYLDCVVNESLRLHPAAPLLLHHESAQACSVRASHRDVYAIPAKTRLIINAWAIGRDPKVWEDPLRFKPERFMGMSFDPVKDQEMRMVPFGAGRRGCPGTSMALATVKIALAQLLHSFDWKIGGGPCELDMKEKFGTTMPRETHLFALPQLRRPLPELCRSDI